MYLFDTDIITNIFKPQPNKNIVNALSTTPDKHQHISTITVFEIVYGAMKSNRPAYHLNNLEQILLPAVIIVGFDAKAAYVCGRLRADLEKTGQPLPLADLEIASIAIANGLTLVTGNTKHFMRIEELKTENWLQ